MGTRPGRHRPRQLASGRVDLDLDHFDDGITAAGQTGTRAARKLLAEVLRLSARGEVLEDEPYAAWAEDLRRTYRARLLGVRLDAAEAALAERDTRAAISHAAAAIGLDRYAERAYRLAMVAHYAQGDQRQALASYQHLRTVLSEDLGLEPTPETCRIQGAVLAQTDPARLLPRPVERRGPPPRPGRFPWSGGGPSWPAWRSWPVRPARLVWPSPWSRERTGWASPGCSPSWPSACPGSASAGVPAQSWSATCPMFPSPLPSATRWEPRPSPTPGRQRWRWCFPSRLRPTPGPRPRDGLVVVFVQDRSTHRGPATR